VPGALDQKTPCPTSGSFSSVASRSSEKCAFARFSAARSPADSRWKTKKLSPWLSSSGGMLPGWPHVPQSHQDPVSSFRAIEKRTTTVLSMAQSTRSPAAGRSANHDHERKTSYTRAFLS
jgi:hypothetical protein